MFDLEQHIAEWRQRMLAAGIGSPVPLEELESHLREEIKRQMDSGRDEATAFAVAAEKVGQPGMLKVEFRRARGLREWLGEEPEARTLRVLSLLWLVYCTGSFLHLAAPLSGIFYAINFQATWDFYAAVILELVYLRGLVASVRLFGGNLREKRILWWIAILDGVGGIIAITAMHQDHLRVWFFTSLGIVSLWLLRPTRKAGLANR